MWADIYSNQIQSGDHYKLLKPTYSIWLHAEDVIDHNKHYAHYYKLREQRGQLLNQTGWHFCVETQLIQTAKFSRK